MGRLPVTVKWLLPIAAASVILLLGCKAQPTPPPIKLSLPELEYRLLASFNDAFWCDPDFYPIGRPGQEEKNALNQLPIIRANEAEFTAILEHLGLPNRTEFTDEEKLLIYREHKKLTYQVQMTVSGDLYRFTLRVWEGPGERIEGTIAPWGEIKVLKREPSFNTCPICLVRGTLIDTPGGPVPVELVYKGMTVWTVDNKGNRVAGLVVKTVETPVPLSFQTVKVTLSDGRTVTASLGHPTSEGRALGAYRVGDILDRASVAAVEHLAYDGGATYDILPFGETGIYWANGILLKSTLSTD
ncbi:MAG: Hint domain-containing protein [Dehalococcoidia bacterium]|nr:Hint domain-containing protein [Dehalococcoidia bacterium]